MDEVPLYRGSAPLQRLPEDRVHHAVGAYSRPTGVPHIQENAPPWDPTVGLCLLGGARGGGRFIMGELPL